MIELFNAGENYSSISFQVEFFMILCVHIVGADSKTALIVRLFAESSEEIL